ncbi:SdpI family protein [Listeria ilorinensis]|uniref:SdpI family protein n=1 Tax=Listeria ilorinensis TaxID=2867439 RepID=UPI001EF3D79B|nr:SdpI family protein [Listeria ilorinensis]
MLDILIPLLLIVLGIIFYLSPPKKRSSTLSYRTKNSLLSATHFHEAHVFLGKLWLIGGLILFVIYIILLFLPLALLVRSSLFFMLSLVTIFGSIIWTEKHLEHLKQ